MEKKWFRWENTKTKRHVGENKFNIYANSRAQYTSDSYHNAGTN